MWQQRFVVASRHVFQTCRTGGFMASEPRGGEPARSIIFRDQKGNFYSLPEERLDELRMSDDEVEKFLASSSAGSAAPAGASMAGLSAAPSAFVRASPEAFLRATPSAFMRA